MPPPWAELERRLRKAGSPSAVAPFRHYVDLLLEYRSRLNLTAAATAAELASLHLLDSLELLRIAGPRPPASGIDVGSGAGLPGIPLALAEPLWNMTLLEARTKRAAFLRTVNQRLGCTNIRVLQGRAEEVARDPALREQFHLSLARALAPPPAAAECCLPFVRVEGRCFFWVGPSFSPEDVLPALGELGGRLEDVHRYELQPGSRRRAIAVVVKVSPTPDRYPRRPGVPRKRPLA